MTIMATEKPTTEMLDFTELAAGDRFRFSYPAEGKQPARLSVGTFVKGDGDSFWETFVGRVRRMSEVDAPMTTRVVRW